jgi:hypothetical protein
MDRRDRLLAAADQTMIDALWVMAAFCLCLLLCELALRGTKVQTGLSRVLVVHFLCWLAVLVMMMSARRVGFVAITGFWAGGFLSWFGVRSHAESSILLRMLYLLRKGPKMTEEWLKEYHSHYGPELRIEELFRAGLIAGKPEGAVVTAKGERILKAVSWLR